MKNPVPNSRIADLSTKMILVVDDEADIRIVLSRKLKRLGYECRSAKDGVDALAEVESHRFDLILLDINMPRLSGPEVLSRVRQIDDTTPIVMVSSVDSFDSVRNTLREGACDYLVKPIDFDEFDITVARAIEHGRLLRENREYQKDLEVKVEQRTKELSVALEEIRRTYHRTILALGAALETRDTETQTHSLRVAHYSRVLAVALGVGDETELTDIERGAYLHDIGKIGVPDRILRKPGSLTDEEWVIMKRHPEIGSRLIQRIEFLRGAAPIVRCHHERYDGSGYPQGLHGETIPRGAKIFAIADALDAMTSERPYGTVVTFEVARRRIVSDSGTHFDPRIVEVYSTMPKSTFVDDIVDFTD